MCNATFRKGYNNPKRTLMSINILHEETPTLKVFEKYLTSLSGKSNKSLGASGGMCMVIVGETHKQHPYTEKNTIKK
jgi:hypothetical protein